MFNIQCFPINFICKFTFMFCVYYTFRVMNTYEHISAPKTIHCSPLSCLHSTPVSGLVLLLAFNQALRYSLLQQKKKESLNHFAIVLPLIFERTAKSSFVSHQHHKILPSSFKFSISDNTTLRSAVCWLLYFRDSVKSLRPQKRLSYFAAVVVSGYPVL